jgi:hypothetical protein
MLDIIVPVSLQTNGCPEKQGAAQGQVRVPPEMQKQEVRRAEPLAAFRKP